MSHRGVPCRRPWVNTAYPLGQATTPGHQVVECIFPESLLLCGGGLWTRAQLTSPCLVLCQEMNTVVLRLSLFMRWMREGPMGWWLGNWEGSIFSSRAEESEHCCLLFGGGWWEKPDSCIWQFRAPGSLGSEAWVWPFFLKGGIAPASC